eukprot:m.472497 g.472497  ORF g.472497 m.472497 type:complete len:386 (+) comp21661_c3_seq16:202-1359(+)
MYRIQTLKRLSHYTRTIARNEVRATLFLDRITCTTHKELFTHIYHIRRCHLVSECPLYTPTLRLTQQVQLFTMNAASMTKDDARAAVLGLEPLGKPMVSLDKQAFTKIVKIKGLQIKPQLCKHLLKKLHRDLLNLPRQKNIVSDVDDAKLKVLLLCPSITNFEDLDAASIECIKACDSDVNLIDYSLTLSFDYWSADQLLRAALPSEVKEVTSSFETIGHIAHMNLRDEQLPYKNLIGEIIKEKNSGIRTVINKLASIDTTFRFFKLEVIAGEEDFKTTVKESDCRFTMEYDKVYWNSRLHTEHSRIVRMLKPNDVVLDIMGGIAPRMSLPSPLHVHVNGIVRHHCTRRVNRLSQQPCSLLMWCNNAENRVKLYQLYRLIVIDID